jgi:hypothetical protein
MYRATYLAILIAALAINVLFPARYANAEDLLPCDPEPTRMAINFGDHVECQINPATDIDFYDFNGTSGEVIRLALLDMTGGCGGFSNYPCPVGFLYGPTDPVNPILTLGPGTRQATPTLTETGKYTLRIRESGDDQTETYRISLERVFPASPTAKSIRFAEQVDDTLSPAPDQDFYLFSATKGDFIQMTLLDLTGGCGGFSNYPCPVAYLYDPIENYMGFQLGPGTQSKEVELPESGVYTLLIVENGEDQTESYRLSLECLAGKCLEPPLILSPAKHDFGNIPIGCRPLQGFALENNSSEDVEVTAVAVEGAAATDFIIYSDTCSGKTLKPAETCTFEVGFEPTALGSKNSNLTISFGTPEISPVFASLKGLVTEICECNLNKDQSCNILDYQIFIQDWGRTDCGTPPGSGNSPNDCECDLKPDGRCNILDYQMFIQNWGRTDCPVCPQP